MRTVSVALVLCLNVGVDPPDVVKTNPCARMECWIGKYRKFYIGSKGVLLNHILPDIYELWKLQIVYKGINTSFLGDVKCIYIIYYKYIYCYIPSSSTNKKKKEQKAPLTSIYLHLIRRRQLSFLLHRQSGELFGVSPLAK